MQLLLATTNRGKIIEIASALHGLVDTVQSPADFGILESPEEHGTTYAQNALIKARFYYDRVKMPTLADDSGIVVEALQNELGVTTRRWGAGADASDAEWIDFFLRRMEQESNRRARFICVLAYIDGAGTEHTFEGVCDGVITPTLEADYLPGLPISACFKPDGYDTVYSAMSHEQKNSTSHRGRAVEKFKDFLRKRPPSLER